MRVSGALTRTRRYLGTEDGMTSFVPGAARAASQIRFVRDMAMQPAVENPGRRH